MDRYKAFSRINIKNNSDLEISEGRREKSEDDGSGSRAGGASSGLDGHGRRGIK